MADPKERPILFQGAMVRAILAGTKTQTRRAWREQPPAGVMVGYVPGQTRSPYGQPGDRLVVRESWQYADWTEDGYPWIRYQADGAKRLIERGIPEEWSERLTDTWADLSSEANYGIDSKAADRRWRPSIHMPRWASRLTLEITDVRVERLQDISTADAEAEGIDEWAEYAHGAAWRHATRYVDQYAALWESINGVGSWDANPLVWAVSFRRLATPGQTSGGTQG